MAYFEKVREDGRIVCYSYGPDVTELGRELTLVKQEKRAVELPEELGHTGRKAARKIIEIYLERGEWPEKGASVS